MSPRTDSYLSVCLQEASKSPLHYRHGCVVVSGGKIIGKGFNDYRPGFNGGALKTGKLATSTALNGSAIAAIKQKQKSKSKAPLLLESTAVGNDQRHNSKAAFIPFETATIGSSGGGGHLANTPLSMHSEMMAIHSALALSSTLESQGSARSSGWLEKPCFKLPSRGKRELRLRGLKAYVEAVCGGQNATLHVNAAKEKGCECKDNNKEGEEKEEENRERNVRTLPGKSAEKVSVQDQCGYHHEEKYQGRIHHHGVMYGQQRQQQHVHRHKEPHTFDLPVATNGKASALAGSEHPFGSTAPSGSPSHLSCFSKADTHLKQTRGHLKTSPIILVSRAATEVKAHSVADRMKDPRLRGADIYVARLGWKKQETIELLPTKSNRTQPLPHSDTDNPPLSQTKTPTGSLHEELSLASPSSATVHQLPVYEKPSVSASRPCYRCICYMHTVGIKRVFWTNSKGEWEGGKVRDMMDALDLAGSCGDGRGRSGGPMGGAAGNGVFVTKHEVLMLRRLMGS